MNVSKVEQFLQTSIVALLVLFLDQFTKQSVFFYMRNGDHELGPINWIKIAFTTNSGAALGLQLGGNAFYIFFGVFVMILLGAWFWREPKVFEQRVMRLALGLVLGGIVGNLIDRLLHHAVYDYIAISVLPVFNLADAALVGGILVLAYNYFIQSHKTLLKP